MYLSQCLRVYIGATIIVPLFTTLKIKKSWYLSVLFKSNHFLSFEKKYNQSFIQGRLCN